MLTPSLQHSIRTWMKMNKIDCGESGYFGSLVLFFAAQQRHHLHSSQTGMFELQHVWQSYIYDLCIAAKSSATPTKLSIDDQHVHTSADHFLNYRSNV